MASVEELLIKLRADNSDLKAKLNESQKSVSGFGSSINMLKAGFAVAGAAAVAFGRASFAAFEEADKADRKLLFALNGNQAAFESLTRQANDLRNATGIDDEDIKNIQMLGVSSGKSAGEVKKITQAAIELSSKTGQDLQASYMMLNATLAGSAGRLARVDKEFANLTADQLRNGDAIELVLKKWSGSAANAATESEKLNTNWGEIKETVGGGLATVINPLMKEFNDRLKAAADSSLTLSQRLTALGNSDYARFAEEANKNFTANLATTRQMSAHEAKMADISKQRLEIENKLIWARGVLNAKTDDGNKKNLTSLELYISKMEEMYTKQQNWNQFAVPQATAGMFGSDVKSMQPKGITTGKNTSYFDAQINGADKLAESLSKLQVQLSYVRSEELQLYQATLSGNTAMDAFMSIVSDGATDLESMGKAMYNSARQAIAAEMAQGIAAAVRSVLVGVPFPLNLILAAGAGAAAGTLFNSLVPKLAGGGIAYGTTNAVVGEYPGASSNPEVIAPLDKLQTLLGGNRVEVFGTIRAGDIYLSNERGKYLKQRRG